MYRGSHQQPERIIRVAGEWCRGLESLRAACSRPCGRCDRCRDEQEEGPSKRHQLNEERDRLIDRQINGRRRSPRWGREPRVTENSSEPAWDLEVDKTVQITTIASVTESHTCLIGQVTSQMGGRHNSRREWSVVCPPCNKHTRIWPLCPARHKKASDITEEINCSKSPTLGCSRGGLLLCRRLSQLTQYARLLCWIRASH